MIRRAITWLKFAATDAAPSWQNWCAVWIFIAAQVAVSAVIALPLYFICGAL